MSHPASRLLHALCSVLLVACNHLGGDDAPSFDPVEAAQTLDRDLLLLVDGATTLTDNVQGVEVETRIALTPAETEATWIRAVEAFDAVQPHLALSPREQLALEYQFALLHRALEEDGSEEAAALHAELSPHLSRLAPGDLAVR